MTQDKRRQRGFSRRKFMQTAAAGAAAAASGTMLGGAAQAHGKKKKPNLDPDVILQNGRIHTMDERSTVASSVAIKDGRFMQVERGRSHINAGRKTRVIDLRGRTVVPGIIDNHNHLVLMGNRPGYHTPLENAHSIAEALATYAARVKEVPPGAWITTIGGFHFNHLYANPADKLTGRFPTLAELDTVTPNNPVWASISFNGPSVTNTAGRNILNGLVVDGQPITVAADGAIAGAGGQSTRVLLHLRQTLLNAAERRRSTLDAMKYAAGLGVTTHIDQGAFQATNTAADGAAHEDNFTMQFPFLGNDMVKTGGIGEFIAQGTAVPGRFLEAARKVAKAGWRAEVHSLGRRASATSAPLRVCASASRRALSARAVVICASIFDSSVSRRLLAERTALSALARASAISAFFCTSADYRRPMLSR